MTKSLSHHPAGWPRLVQDSRKVPRVRVELARPLEAQIQNWYDIASAMFSWPKQVTSLAQMQGVEKEILPLDGIAAKSCCHFWSLPHPSM